MVGVGGRVFGIGFADDIFVDLGLFIFVVVFVIEG